MNSPDESPLVQQIRQRNPESLAVFIEQNRSQLAGFIRSITSNRLLSMVELDDLIQDVAAAALKGLETAPLDEYEPMHWLQQVARRRVIDAHRFHFDAKRRDAGRQQSIHAQNEGGSDVPGLEQLLAASMTSPSAAMSQDIRLARMQQAIGELSEEQRTVVRLRYVDGLTSKKIAEALGKTDVAIRVLLSRSMRLLEKQLEDVKPSR